jgi:Tfp pilus assembly protein PilN
MVDINLIPREYRERKLGIKAIISKTTIIALAVLILSLFFYGGLLFYKKNLVNNLEVINQEILELEQKRNPKTEKAMVDLDKRINVLKKLFENHLYWSNLFEEIEKLIIPEAYFMGAEIKLSGDALKFNSSGGTTSYTNLARQILSFQEEPLISSVKVSDIALDEKMGIKFSVSVNFFKKILLENSDNND